MKECPVCKKQFGFFAGAFGKFQEHVDGCEPAAKPYTPPPRVMPRTLATPPQPITCTVTRTEERRIDDGSCLATSMAIGALTGNPLLGMAVGGSLAGGMIGASMHHDDSPSHTPDVRGHGGEFDGGGSSSSWSDDSSSPSSSSSYSSSDSCSSYDSGSSSSCDSSSSSSFD